MVRALLVHLVGIALIGGANILVHGAGRPDGSLTASTEKFIMDVEIPQMFAETLKPAEVSTATLATDAGADAGHFLATPPTIDRCATAFVSTPVSDRSNFANRRGNGAIDATVRANRICKHRPKRFGAPLLDAARMEQINALTARHKRQGAANIERQISNARRTTTHRRKS